MKILNSLAIVGLGIILSFQANAGTIDFGKVTCIAQYGEGYSWVVLSIETNFEKHNKDCLRCPRPEIVTTATISVPYGPRGSYITQAYAHKETVHNRLSSSTFQKIAQPSGHYSGDWGQWFSEEIEVLSGSLEPLYLNFKGQSLDLECK
jgi:hypothetical protein